MKLQPDKAQVPTVLAYGPDWIQINQFRFGQSVVVSALPDQPPRALHDTPGLEVREGDLEALAQSGADIVIFGTGTRLVFPPASWMRAFAQARVGLEVMDTAAACRTYNILASEGRKVVALLSLPA